MEIKKYPRGVGYINESKESVYIVVTSKQWGTVDVLMDKADFAYLVTNGMNIIRRSKNSLAISPSGTSLYKEVFGCPLHSLRMLNKNSCDLRRSNVFVKPTSGEVMMKSLYLMIPNIDTLLKRHVTEQ